MREIIKMGDLKDNENILQPTLGSSYVIEPDIVNTMVKPTIPTWNKALIYNEEEIGIWQLPNDQSIVRSINQNTDAESSATTEQTKTYVSGGTEPDSEIVIKKPTTKYYIYGIFGIVTAFVAYKVFFNKKA
jgi:hypothetical protein